MMDTSNPLEARPNGTMDDIASVIGFTAALRLCAWYGDTNASFYVPETATEGHEIARLIGMPAFTRLVGEWGRELLSIPTLENFKEDCRHRNVRDLLARGLNPREVGRFVQLGTRRVEQLRTHLESAGMLPPAGEGENARQKRQGKMPVKNAGQNAG